MGESFPLWSLRSGALSPIVHPSPGTTPGPTNGTQDMTNPSNNQLAHLGHYQSQYLHALAGEEAPSLTCAICGQRAFSGCLTPPMKRAHPFQPASTETETETEPLFSEGERLEISVNTLRAEVGRLTRERDEARAELERVTAERDADQS